MINYILITILIVIGSVLYKISKSNKKPENPIPVSDTFDGPIQRQSMRFHKDNFDMNLAFEAYKEREEIKRKVINDIKNKK